MNKEFAPYEESLELKQLGFDEPCFTWYWDDIGLYNGLEYSNHNKREHVVSAPLYQQAFRWLYKQLGRDGFGVMSIDTDKCNEELRKLIEIVKIK
jgi:hypothetical protein